jgi:hypothetical protein
MPAGSSMSVRAKEMSRGIVTERKGWPPNIVRRAGLYRKDQLNETPRPARPARPSFAPDPETQAVPDRASYEDRSSQSMEGCRPAPKRMP